MGVDNNYNGTIDHLEVEKFASDSSQWWDESGDFAPLHKMNPIRLSYIRDKCSEFFFDKEEKYPKDVLLGKEVLDIGCGGGLLSVPMSRMGGNVTGIDASEASIKAAKDYIRGKELNIRYFCSTVEQFAQEDKKYDVITAMEVIEHVHNPKLFLNSAYKLLKPGGIMFISTIARTLKSYMLTIFWAEYLLRWLPIGTHCWDKFLNHTEVIKMFDDVNVLDVSGMSYHPIHKKWSISKDLQVNYALCIRKMQ